MDSTEGLVRGADVTDTGEAITVPVGPETLGRLINVIGETIDEGNPIKSKMSWPIHRPAPEYVDQSTEAEILVTGIKVVDLLAPYAKGGKIGLFGTSMGAGTAAITFSQDKRFNSVWLDSGFSDMQKIIEEELEYQGLPTFLGGAGVFLSLIHISEPTSPY